MNIETKYNIKDKVWHPWSESVKLAKVCPACGGQKVKNIDGFNFFCNNCSASGKIFHYGAFVEEPQLCTIKSLACKVDEDGKISDMYKIHINGIGSSYVSGDYLFKTFEECKKRCDENTKATNDLLKDGWEFYEED